MTSGADNGHASLIDCRWLGRGGVGRATELLLRGLKEVEPAGDWIVWGPPEVARFCWPSARFVLAGGDPRRFAGQASPRAIPPHGRALYLHQVRPLLPNRPSVTIIHDTVPLRSARGRAATIAKTAYFRIVAARSSGILTVSEQSAFRIVSDLGVQPSQVKVVQYPVDADSVARVLDLRSTVRPTGHLLYVGRIAPHKNVDRLLEAFASTRFRAGGGRLVVVCATEREGSAVAVKASELGCVDSVDTGFRIAQAELEELFAGAAALVQPSIEEGFGLPVWEARSCGLPRCVSRIPPLDALAGPEGFLFDPEDVHEMERAIDAAVRADWAVPLAGGPSIGEFARAVLDGLDDYAPLPETGNAAAMADSRWNAREVRE